MDFQHDAAVHRHINVLRARRVDSEKLRGADPHDEERIAVDQHLLAHSLGGLAEAPLGVAVAQGGGERRAFAVIGRVDQAAGPRGHAESAKELAGDVLGARQVGLSANLDIERSGARKSKHGREYGFVGPQFFEEAVRHVSTGQAQLRFPPRTAAGIMDHRWVLFGVPIENDQRFGILHRQGA